MNYIKLRYFYTNRSLSYTKALSSNKIFGYVVPKCHPPSISRFHLYCTSRDTITHQDHLNKLHATAAYTLQSRILKYMRTSNKFSTVLSDKSATSCFILQEDHQWSKIVFKTQRELLPQLLLDVSNHLTNLPSHNFLSLLQEIDRRCCRELDKMSRTDILKTLDGWMYVLPHRLITVHFYLAVLNVMKLWLINNQAELSKEHFLQILFYFGLLKKSPQSRELMHRCLHYIDHAINMQELSVLELCLLSNAIFKTSTKITSKKILTAISSTIENQMDLLLLDPALLVTLIKPLRHAEFYEDTLLEVMSHKIISNIAMMDFSYFVAKVHILALYAAAKYSRRDVIDHLVASCLVDLKTSLTSSSELNVNSYLSERPRKKDLARFLWSISSLNIDIDKPTVDDIIIPLLNERLQNGEFEKDPQDIIDCLLSLWILGHKPCDFIVQALSSNILAALQKKNNRRFNSRLALLLTCIEIEEPQLLGVHPQLLRNRISEVKPSITRHLTKRPSLQKVYMCISILAQNYGFSKITCNFIIPHLNIAGLTVDTLSGPLYIEVSDQSVCLHKSEKLQGLMQLKLRLLKSLHSPLNLILIRGCDIEQMAEQDYLSYLETELHKAARIF